MVILVIEDEDVRSPTPLSPLDVLSHTLLLRLHPIHIIFARSCLQERTRVATVVFYYWMNCDNRIGLDDTYRIG